MSDYVFDCSALLALLQAERGAERVKSLADGALVSAVNLAEAHTKLVGKGVPEKISWDRLAMLGCRIVFFDEDQARLAGSLVAVTRPYGLSVGDRACLALAIQRRATAYTADRVWANLSLGIRIEVIR